MEHPSHPVESHWRTSLRNRIIQASSLLEVLLSGLVLIGLLLSVVPLIRWMPGLLFDGNEAEIRTFLERSLDIVIGIEFIKMLAKHSPGSSLEGCFTPLHAIWWWGTIPPWRTCSALARSR